MRTSSEVSIPLIEKRIPKDVAEKSLMHHGSSVQIYSAFKINALAIEK